METPGERPRPKRVRKPGFEQASAEVSPAVLDNLSKNPTVRFSKVLLSKSVAVRVPKTRGREVEFDVAAVEPFDGLDKKEMLESFDSCKREKGEIFITWSRGIPSLNIVHDPEKRSVVCIGALKLDEESYTFQRVLSEILEIKPRTGKGYPRYRQAVNGLLDGQSGMETGTSSPLYLKDSKDEALAKRLSYEFGRRAKNSLGKIFVEK